MGNAREALEKHLIQALPARVLADLTDYSTVGVGGYDPVRISQFALFNKARKGGG